jgi:hypothetical protein
VHQVPFEIVALLDAKLFSSLNNELEIVSALDQYYLILEVCGWSVQEYEKELLKRIDKEWDRCRLNSN